MFLYEAYLPPYALLFASSLALTFPNVSQVDIGKFLIHLYLTHCKN